MSMSPLIEAEYRRALRSLMEREGVPVEISKTDRAAFPHSPDLWVSVYGWRDGDGWAHCLSKGYRAGKCRWVLPERVSITEVSYSEFQDTFSPNADQVGINAEGVDDGIRCACGKYRDVTLRYEASLGEVMQEILGLKTPGMVV